MHDQPASRLLQFTEHVYELAQDAVADHASKYSPTTYTQPPHIALVCLKVRENKTYRDLVDTLIEMPRIRDALDLDELPDYSTVCKALHRLTMHVWRILLRQSSHLLPGNRLAGIDASGFERSFASRHYTKRAGLTIQQLKTTLLVDTRHNLVLDLHITTTRKHDTQIAPQVVARNTDQIEILVGDKGYDDQALRDQCHAAGIRPVVRHREFSGLHKAWNARQDESVYGQRAQCEAVNSTIKRRFGSQVRSRIWYMQFREVTVKAIVHNVERALARSSIVSPSWASGRGRTAA